LKPNESSSRNPYDQDIPTRSQTYMFDELEQLQQKNRSALNMVRVKSNAI
jgi:hypothetical protein